MTARSDDRYPWFPQVAALIVGLLAVVGVACASADEGAVNDVEPSSLSDVLALSLLRGGSIVDGVLDQTVVGCMAEQGFDIAGLGGNDDEEFDGWPEVDVEAYGYGVSIEPPQPFEVAKDPLAEAVAQLTPAEVDAFHLALLGSIDPAAQPSPNSCLGRAFREISELQQMLTGDVARLAADYAVRVDADARLLQAKDDWRSCMSEQGFGDYDDRLEIIDEIARRLRSADVDLADVQEFELLVARADFACSAAEFEARREVEAELSASFAADLAELGLLSDERD